ncbi:pre-mRNA-splicing regulator female-lethal(2)D isoform X2 [Lycorma delicatula]|uniref:pre-mRNA-splicing regulator female-lethal(2)D isoform X2 n=1 Tax=Lycorma delicatula TaxID=130591 RepID=UPI003F50F285
MSEEVNVKTEEVVDGGALVTVSVATAASATATLPTAASVAVVALTTSTSVYNASVIATTNNSVTSTSITSTSNTTVSAQSNSAGPPAVEHERIKLTVQQLENVPHSELVKLWRSQDSFIDMLEAQMATNEEISTLRETEARLKQQHGDLVLREKVLVRRLAAKEQEIQEYAGQLSELKAGQAPGAVALRQALLDPAVNLLLQRLRQELHSTRTRLEETQNELSAWKFTPDSNTGKRLMAKCRLLYQENEELGKMISSGRLAKLEGDLALQKSFSEEVKKSQSELDEFLQDLDEDVEGMQSTIYYLQQELRKSKETAVNLEQELNNLRTSGSESNVDGMRVCGSSVNGVNDNSFSVPCELIIKQEERTNGISKIKDEWGNCKGDEEVSTDSSELVLKINIEDELCDGKLDTQQDGTSESSDMRTVTNNNRVDRSPRKRTSSEDSDDVPLSKKVKIDNSEISVHYNDDEIGLVNGESAQLSNSCGQ